MGVFDFTDADMPCDCPCPGHSLRRELEHQIAELKREVALLRAAVTSAFDRPPPNEP